MSVKYLFEDFKAASAGCSGIKKCFVALANHCFHMVIIIRLGSALGALPFLGPMLRVFFEYFLRIFFSSDISLKACIGPGLVVVHGHDIVIGADVKIGRNLKIFNGVTLGNKDVFLNSKGNQPTLGDNVILCTGAKVLGPIMIGNSVLVGANSVVVKDFPDNVVVAGCPAKIMRAN